MTKTDILKLPGYIIGIVLFSIALIVLSPVLISGALIDYIDWCFSEEGAGE